MLHLPSLLNSWNCSCLGNLQMSRGTQKTAEAGTEGLVEVLAYLSQSPTGLLKKSRIEIIKTYPLQLDNHRMLQLGFCSDSGSL